MHISLLTPGLFFSLFRRFADLVGFTAWSSVREPSQVFQLLEIIYHGKYRPWLEYSSQRLRLIKLLLPVAYDQIAKRRRVFKVETVGDCYVAAAG